MKVMTLRKCLWRVNGDGNGVELASLNLCIKFVMRLARINHSELTNKPRTLRKERNLYHEIMQIMCWEEMVLLSVPKLNARAALVLYWQISSDYCESLIIAHNSFCNLLVNLWHQNISSVCHGSVMSIVINQLII